MSNRTTEELFTPVSAKSGDIVTFISVLGDRGIGTYSMTSEITGSHLIENCNMESGSRADYQWAESID